MENPSFVNLLVFLGFIAFVYLFNEIERKMPLVKKVVTNFLQKIKN